MHWTPSLELHRLSVSIRIPAEISFSEGILKKSLNKGWFVKVVGEVKGTDWRCEGQWTACPPLRCERVIEGSIPRRNAPSAFAYRRGSWGELPQTSLLLPLLPSPVSIAVGSSQGARMQFLRSVCRDMEQGEGWRADREGKGSTWIWSPAWPLVSCVTSIWLPNFSILWLPHSWTKWGRS